MPITVVTPPTHTRLTTVDAVAEQLQLSSSELTTNETRIEALIDRASTFVTTYTGRTFGVRTLKETLVSPNTMPMMGGFRLILTGTPVNSITEVKHNDSVIDSTYYFIEDPEAGFVFHKYRFFSSTIYTGPIVLQPTRYGQYDWEITYDCGYVMPEDTENRTLPYDLEMAVIQMVANSYRGQSIDTSVSRETIGESSVSYSRTTRQGSIPEGTMDILDYYKITVS